MKERLFDTNLLVRAFVADDPEQAEMARALLDRATAAIIPVPAFCEFAWVLSRSFKIWDKITATFQRSF